jgi:GMP synthase (glutamine-hydrolysing)
MERNMRVLVIENLKGTHYGQVGVALAEANATLDERRPWNGEALPETADRHDAIVVFGGEQSAIDDKDHPYLPDVARLMRLFGEKDKPVLGICLGSQLLARAYGATNHIGTAPEFGWREVELRSEAKEDPVLSGLPERFTSFQWHDDTFTLPEGATLLASSPVAQHQCFRIGRATYGMQFHFEASREVVERWNVDCADLLRRRHPEWLEKYPEHAERHGPAAEAAGLEIARRWVSLIGT